MAISTPGIGSGLDVNNIISQLVALERKPINQVQSQIGTLQTSISAWGQIRSGLAKLQDASSRLASTNLWQGNTAASGDDSAIAARATTGNAIAGSYAVQVQALAQAQSVRSSVSFAADTALGFAGQLELTPGSWNGGSFTGAGPAVSVSITASDKLSDIASKINQANAGVRASVVRNGGQETLVVKSSQTGAANGFEIRAFDSGNNLITDGSTGLGIFSYYNNGGGIVGQTLTAAAQNAAIVIDGIAITGATNTFSDTIAGLSLEAKKVTSAPVTVTVGPDTGAMKDAVKAFQEAFNALSNTIKDLTRADPNGQGNGPLRGDQAAIGLLTMLRNYAGASGPGPGPTRLTDIGLEFTRDGTLSLNTASLDSAIANPAQLQGLFADPSAGIASRLKTFVSDVLAASGTVGSRQRYLQESVARKNQEITRLEERIDRTEKRLRAQYAALDATVAGYNGLSSFINQQLSVWSQSKK